MQTEETSTQQHASLVVFPDTEPKQEAAMHAANGILAQPSGRSHDAAVAGLVETAAAGGNPGPPVTQGQQAPNQAVSADPTDSMSAAKHLEEATAAVPPAAKPVLSAAQVCACAWWISECSCSDVFEGMHHLPGKLWLCDMLPILFYSGARLRGSARSLPGR